MKDIANLKIKLQSPLYDAWEMFIFECFTGLRISDILTLRWGHIKNNTITIKMRKTDNVVSIPLADCIQEILDKHKNRLVKNNEQVNSDKYVFNVLKVDVNKVTDHDAHNAISSATAIMNKKLKTIAKIKKNLSTHIGRHTFATMLITKDVNIRVVQQLLGHCDLRATTIYAGVTGCKKEEAVYLLNNW